MSKRKNKNKPNIQVNLPKKDKEQIQIPSEPFQSIVAKINNFLIKETGIRIKVKEIKDKKDFYNIYLIDYKREIKPLPEFVIYGCKDKEDTENWLNKHYNRCIEFFSKK
jgi:hypothetical protein